MLLYVVTIAFLIVTVNSIFFFFLAVLFTAVALRPKRCSCHFFRGFPGKCKPSSVKGSRSEASSGARHLFRKKLVRFLRKLMVKK